MLNMKPMSRITMFPEVKTMIVLAKQFLRSIQDKKITLYDELVIPSVWIRELVFIDVAFLS